MAIKTIALSRLEADPLGTLNDCADSGEAVVVELPDRRLVAIQPLDAHGEDALMNDLLVSDPEFEALVARSKASPGRAFP